MNNNPPVSQQFLNFIQDVKIKEMVPSKMLEFNSLIRRLETKEDNEAQESFFKTILSIERDDIQKIKNDSFAWTVERARELKTFFTQFVNLESLFYLEFCNNDYLQKKMDLSFFKYYASVNYGRVGGTTAYDEVIRVMSKMLHFFNFSLSFIFFVFSHL